MYEVKTYYPDEAVRGCRGSGEANTKNKSNV